MANTNSHSNKSAVPIDTENQHKIAVVNSASAKPVIKNRFQTLWDEAEQIRKDNLTLAADLNSLVQRLRSEVLPAELATGESLRSHTEKLLDFASRKSLAKWERQVLFEWIDSNVTELIELGMFDAELFNAMAELQAQLLGVKLDPDDDREAADQLADILQKEIAEDDDEIATTQFEFFDDEVDLADILLDFEDEFDAEFADDKTAEHAEKASSNTAPKDLFNTLFRRIARAIHPDKEHDPAKVAAKQELMKSLLEARKQKDLMAVFKLYHEHVTEDTDFSDEDYKQLEAVLQEFINNETSRRCDIINSSPEHAFAFRSLYNKSDLQITRRINKQIRELTRRKQEIDLFSRTVRSLKTLKPYLEDRCLDIDVLW